MPRKITNLAGLPGPMFTALASDTYTGSGDISITRLINPPRITALRKYHEDDIVEDASSRIWSLLGSSTHRMLELSASEDVKVEARLSMEIEGWTLSGQPDLYEPKAQRISDYKITSVWSVLFGDKPEWEAQVNLQAMLHRHNGDLVNEGQIVAVLRDWQIRKAKFEKDYPPTAVKRIPIPMWTQEQCIAYAAKRIKLHQKAQQEYEATRNPDSLPLCTPEERWLRGAVHAVKFQDKSGKVNKNAKRKFDTEEAAKEYMRANADALPKGKVWAPIEYRPGENIRCLDYCPVNAFCDFYKNLMAQRQPEPQGDPELFDEDAGN